MELQPTLETCSNNSNSSSMDNEDILEGWLCVAPMGNSLEGNFPDALPATKPSTPPSVNSEKQNTPPESRASNSSAISALDQSPLSGVSSSGHSLTIASSGNTSAEPPAPRKRRGHTKSRLGCITCKRRKIKCQEQWPSCANCIKRGSPCRYPSVFKHTQQDRLVSEVMKSPRLPMKLSDSPTMYSAHDMRLFHHFMIAAHPCVPYEYEGVWVRDIPAFSHHYDYLMHAMLALSGSHLSVLIEDPKANMALTHRQIAIKGLEQAFTRWPPKAEEAHVMLATCYLLAFQSSYMPDGILDHVLSLRGCTLVSQMILQHDLEGTFSVDANMHNSLILEKLQKFSLLDPRLSRDALSSLIGLASLLEDPSAHDIERAVFAQLVGTLQPLLIHIPPDNQAPTQSPDVDPPDTSYCCSPYKLCSFSPSETPFTLPSPDPDRDPYLKHPLIPSSPTATFNAILGQIRADSLLNVPPDTIPQPRQSFNALMSSLLILCTWPQSAVLHLFSPSNPRGAVILAHFIAVRFIVSPLSAPDSAMRAPVGAMVEWFERVLEQISDLESEEKERWEGYVEWPRKVLRTLRGLVNQKRGLSFGDILGVLLKDPGAFREGRGVRIDGAVV